MASPSANGIRSCRDGWWSEMILTEELEAAGQTVTRRGPAPHSTQLRSSSRLCPRGPHLHRSLCRRLCLPGIQAKAGVI